MSEYTKAICARATNALCKLNKEILTQQDVENALSEAEIDSKDGIRKYASSGGYLENGGWLKRVIGGWTLAPEAIPTGVIVVKVVPGKATVAVFNKIGKALEQYKGVVEIRMEV